MARFPVIGQIMEPGRQFHPPVTSVRVQAIYDTESIAVLVRWHDMRADNTGKSDPTLVVPIEEEEEAGAPSKGDAAAQAAAAAADPFAETAAAPTAPPSEFNDAVAVQIPSAVPTGARKPYFIFGDAQNSVDLWYFDLGRQEPIQFTGRGSADLARERHGRSHGCRELRPGRMVGDLQAAASPKRGRAVHVRRVPADRLLGVGRILARSWQQAGAHVLVFDLHGAGSGSIAARTDGEDGAADSRHRTLVIGWVRWSHGSRARGELGGAPSHPAATRV